MNSTTVYDVVVVGGGIMGAASAYYVSKSLNNGKVLLMEQFEFLHRKGSSHGDSRIIRKSYDKAVYTRLMMETFQLWGEAEKESGMKVYTPTGGLDFSELDSPYIKTVLAVAEECKLETQIITSAEELQKRYPLLKLPPGYVAMYSPDAGILNATKAVAMYLQLARANGCELRDQCAVEKLSVRQSADGSILHEIQLSSGDVCTAKKIVIAAGAWTGKLLNRIVHHQNGGDPRPTKSADIDVAEMLHPVQTTVAYWKIQDRKNYDLYSSKNFPVFIYYGRSLIYGLPAHEYSDMIKCCAHRGPACDPDDRDYLPGMQDLNNSIGRFLSDVFSGIACKSPQLTESCMYTWSTSKDFIIDNLSHVNLPNVVVACGFSGHGFKLAPMVGSMVAELAVNGIINNDEAREEFSIAKNLEIHAAVRNNISGASDTSILKHIQHDAT